MTSWRLSPPLRPPVALASGSTGPSRSEARDRRHGHPRGRDDPGGQRARRPPRLEPEAPRASHGARPPEPRAAPRRGVSRGPGRGQPARVAVDDVARGDALLTPDAWHVTTTLDVRLAPGRAPSISSTNGVRRGTPDPDRLPSHVMVHVGTLAVEARVRPLGPGAVRLGLAERPCPSQPATGSSCATPARDASSGRSSSTPTRLASTDGALRPGAAARSRPWAADRT